MTQLYHHRLRPRKYWIYQAVVIITGGQYIETINWVILENGEKLASRNSRLVCPRYKENVAKGIFQLVDVELFFALSKSQRTFVNICFLFQGERHCVYLRCIILNSMAIWWRNCKTRIARSWGRKEREGGKRLLDFDMKWEKKKKILGIWWRGEMRRFETSWKRLTVNYKVVRLLLLLPPRNILVVPDDSLISSSS